MDNETKGTLLAVATALVSAVSIPLNKFFVVSLSPALFTTVRALLIGLGFFLIAASGSGWNLRKFRKVSWPYLVSIGIIGGGMAFLLYFTGLRLTTAGRAAFLHKTLPLYVAVLAFFFLKEKISRLQLGAMTAMFLGTLMVYYSQIAPGPLWLNPSLGDLLVISATVLWAIESTLAKKAMLKGEQSAVVAFARMFVGGLFLCAILLATGGMGALLLLTARQWGYVLISTGLLFCYTTFWYYSIKLINVSKAACLLLLAPPISLAIGAVFLGEPVTSGQAIGSMAILIGACYMGGAKSEFLENR